MPHDLIPLAELPPGALTTVEIDTVRRFAEEAQAASTRRAYAADWDAFRAWAAARDLAPLPAEPATIAAFLAAEAEAGRKVSTIGRRLAAIRHAHKLAGIDPLPTDAQLVRVTLKGVRRSLGVAPTRKAAATAEVLSAMLKRIPSHTLLGLRDRALLLVGLGCALRRSELVALRVEDLTTTKNGILVNVRRSKTDTEGRGYEIPLLRGVHLCPCEALEAWLAAASVTSGPIFRAIAKGMVSETQLAAQVVSLRCKRYARLAGLDATTLSAHSLRAGFVTSSAEHRADLLRIADVTRHQSLEMLKIYCRRADVWRDHAGAGWL